MTLGLKPVDLGVADNLRESSVPQAQIIKKRSATNKRELAKSLVAANYSEYGMKSPYTMIDLR